LSPLQALLGFVALNPTYILPVLLRNAKPNNGRFQNRAPKVSISIKLARCSGQRRRLYETSGSRIANFEGIRNEFGFYFLDRIYRIDGIFFACSERSFGRRPLYPDDPVDPVRKKI
jgi:hypothetical protein